MRSWRTASSSEGYRGLRIACAFVCTLVWRAAAADDIEFHGFADLRGVAASDDATWTRGGLAKTRYGGNDGLHFGGAALRATWQAAAPLLLVADLRYEPQDRTRAGLIEAYARYRPVSIDAWRWSLKLGEFFPPISLENEGVGWTSLWTLTPSAINTWVGEELRVFGAELRVEHRGDFSTLEAAGALFTANDPAGEILFARGWAFTDLVEGVGNRLREPDVYAYLVGTEPPRRYDPFVEIDHRLGFYGDVTWRTQSGSRATVLYYDNRADPSRYHVFDGHDELFAWRTHFTSVAAQTRFGDLVLMGQGMAGTTEIAPSGFRGEAHFSAAYALAGWELGAWRPALRLDIFDTREDPAAPPALSEHGNALTFALNWRPCDWLRLTGEALRVESTRDQRLALGLAPREVDRQIQFNARFLF
ncbi:MAG TPA: hypothetical protein VFB32_06925 [Rudaea sp.]|nr:hypothetical protein [Rudaea sp.]